MVAKIIYIDIESDPNTEVNSYIQVEELGPSEPARTEYLVRFNDHTLQETFTMQDDAERIEIVQQAIVLVRDYFE